MTSPDSTLLREVGEALYGPYWQSELARDRGVATRTVQRWVAGYPIPAGLWPELREAVLQRRAALGDLAKRLPR